MQTIPWRLAGVLLLLELLSVGAGDDGAASESLRSRNRNQQEHQHQQQQKQQQHQQKQQQRAEKDAPPDPAPQRPVPRSNPREKRGIGTKGKTVRVVHRTGGVTSSTGDRDRDRGGLPGEDPKQRALGAPSATGAFPGPPDPGAEGDARTRTSARTSAVATASASARPSPHREHAEGATLSARPAATRGGAALRS
ncbi:unnamed protein product [Pseudo-nitzschia multistriata]|uniref:Uncharacterized protein n=1 Tax=Pseudo-nitzschia multistriata TaxID=183589 RepID=A0A448ZRZ5_9STRA|nr:unnamed protein product [Pseudo-nitzschia multistriata]